MTAIQRDEAFDRLEDACCAEHDAMCEQRRLVAQAQGIAAGLEAELAALKVLLDHVEIWFAVEYDDMDRGQIVKGSEDAQLALRVYRRNGTLSAEAYSLVAALAADSGDTA